MYDLWTIRPANMVMTFETAAEGERVLRRVADQKGVESLRNHAIIIEDENDDSICIAENEEILSAMTRLRVLEEIRSTLATTFPHLNAEVGAIFESPTDTVTSGQFSDTWLQGFLAAALHDVSIDMESGVVRIGKSLEVPVSDLKSLKPTG